MLVGARQGQEGGGGVNGVLPKRGGYNNPLEYVLKTRYLTGPVGLAGMAVVWQFGQMWLNELVDEVLF